MNSESQKLDCLGRLALGVAHDFNNVLTVIQGHVGLLRSEPGLRPAANESLQQLSRAAERATKLIGQLLTFSRENACEIQLLDLNNVLTDLSLLLHRTLGEDVSVEFTFSSDLPGIRADVATLNQIILSLAARARQSMPRGGFLGINTGHQRVEDTYLVSHPDASVGDFVCLSLMDTGGTNRLKSAACEPDPILETVRALLKQHRGWLEVQGGSGEGSTCRVFFPADCLEQKSEATTARTLHGGNETILVVEDEPAVLWVTRNILEKEGYRVLQASSGIDALAVWHQHRKEIALLLTDVVMPVGVTGEELAAGFLQQKPGLKVIYFSGYSSEAAAPNLALQAGTNFLQKPFEPVNLTRVVRASLDAVRV